MKKTLSLIVTFLLFSSSVLASNVVSMRIIDKSLKAKDLKISNFLINEDTGLPSVVLSYDRNNSSNSAGNNNKQKLNFDLSRDDISQRTLDKISKKRGFFTGSSKFAKIAKGLFTVSTQRGAGGTVISLIEK